MTINTKKLELPYPRAHYGIKATPKVGFVVAHKNGKVLSLAKIPQDKEQALEMARHASLAYQEGILQFTMKTEQIAKALMASKP